MQDFTPFMYIYGLLFLFSSHKADPAYIISVGDGRRQIQLAAKALSDTSVAAHGVIAQHADLFIGTALLLPGFYQRTIVEIDVQVIVVTVLYIHFEHPLSRLGKQSFLQSFQRISATGLFAKVGTLLQTAAFNSRRGIFIGILALFLGFVAQQIHPQSTVLQLLTNSC